MASLRDFDNHWVDWRFPHVQTVCEVVWDPLVSPFFLAKDAYDSGRRRLRVDGGYEDVAPPLPPPEGESLKLELLALPTSPAPATPMPSSSSSTDDAPSYTAALYAA